ncbi:hypothetical protein C2S51_026503 [Perilla frutescens var. frutescens]|nr:hypothetical protein C2S51_026503 [Perilla frutescens var. frutescens]
MDDSSFISESFDSADCKMKMLKSGDTQDRLSELPDSLILKILSSLEMRDVVRTTFLSKRWNDLWTTIPSLCFSNDDVSHDNQEEIQNFINRALLLWKGTKIQKFKIDICGDFDDGTFYCDMDLWLRFAMEKKVEELYLRLPCYDPPLAIDPLPHYFCECSWIRKLSVVECDLHIHGDMHWDQLKNLTIECFSVTEDVINRVVSGAPQLEIFKLSILSVSNENLSIQSSSLKKLWIYKELATKYDPSMSAMLTIWTPNLETLIISGAMSNGFDFEVEWDVVLGEILRQILPTFQYVEKLTLSSWCFEVLAVMIMKGECSFSPLLSVKLLRLDCDLIKPNKIVVLLEIFPKLKMLDIYQNFTDRSSMYPEPGEPLNSEVNTIKSFMVQLRIVEICWVKYEKSIFEFIEFFLNHATVLEKIVIRNRECRNVQAGDMILAAEKLLSLQRSFPNVELIFCKERR